MSSSNLHSVNTNNNSNLEKSSIKLKKESNIPKPTNNKNAHAPQYTSKVSLDLRKQSDARPKAFSPLHKQSAGVGLLSPKLKQPAKVQNLKQTTEKPHQTDNIKQVKQNSSMCNLNKKQQAIYDKLKKTKAENTGQKSEGSKITATVSLATISSVEDDKNKRKGKSINHSNFNRPVNNLDHESINILENAQKHRKILVKKEENIWSKFVSIFTPFSCGNPTDKKPK